MLKFLSMTQSHGPRVLNWLSSRRMERVGIINCHLFVLIYLFPLNIFFDVFRNTGLDWNKERPSKEAEVSCEQWSYWRSEKNPLVAKQRGNNILCVHHRWDPKLYLVLYRFLVMANMGLKNWSKLTKEVCSAEPSCVSTVLFVFAD